MAYENVLYIQSHKYDIRVRKDAPCYIPNLKKARNLLYKKINK